MDERIVYVNSSGVWVIVTPLPCGLTVRQIGIKDVQKGRPFWIINSSDLPADRTFRDALEFDEVELGEPAGVGTNVFI